MHELTTARLSIVQPLIAPLYDGKSAHEVLALLSGQTQVMGHPTVQDYWRSKHAGADFEVFWRKSLHDGFIEGTAFSPKQVAAKGVAANNGQGTTQRGRNHH